MLSFCTGPRQRERSTLRPKRDDIARGEQSFLAGALGVALAVSGVVTAHAGKADEVFRYRPGFEFVEPELTEACGYDVTV